jgi:hypothetical protein
MPQDVGVNTYCDTYVAATRAEKAFRLWQILPCTLAIITTPFVAVLYSLTQSADAGEGSFSIAQAIHGICCIMMMLSLFIVGQLHLLWHRTIRPIMFLVVYAFSTSVISPFPYENVVFAVKLLFLSLVFASAFNLSLYDLRSERWLVTCAWITLILMALSQIAGLITGNTISAYGSRYATGGLIDKASVSATMIVACLPVLLNYFPYTHWAFAGIMLACASVFFTMRRTELIGAVAAVIVVLVYNLNPLQIRISWRKMLPIFLILSVLIICVLRSDAGTDYMTRISELNPSTGTGSGRYIFWSIALEHISNRGVVNKVIGEGIGSIRDLMFQRYGIYIGCHNDWLDLIHAFGMFGIIGLLWWYFELIRFTSFLLYSGHYAFQGVLSIIVMSFCISIGQGGVISEASFVLMYAALGFWAGQLYKNEVD